MHCAAAVNECSPPDAGPDRDNVSIAASGLDDSAEMTSQHSVLAVIGP